jgi:hypothetical protein
MRCEGRRGRRGRHEKVTTIFSSPSRAFHYSCRRILKKESAAPANGASQSPRTTGTAGHRDGSNYPAGGALFYPCPRARCSKHVARREREREREREGAPRCSRAASVSITWRAFVSIVSSRRISSRPFK